MDDPRLPTRSGRFENRLRPARSYTEPRIAMLKEIHTEEQVLFLYIEQSCRTRQCPAWPFTCHITRTWGRQWFHRLRIVRLTHTSLHMSWLLSIPRTASAFGINPPFSGDTNRSNHRWLHPPPQTSWTRPPLRSSWGSRTWRRAKPLNKLRTTSTNSSRLDDTCSSNSSVPGSRTNVAYPLRSDPATSTPRSTCPKNKSNSGLRTGPHSMHKGTNDVFSRTSSLWTLQSSPTRRCNHAAIANNRLCCSCYYPWNNTIWTCTIQTSTSSFATIAAPKSARCFIQDDTSHQTNKPSKGRRPWTRIHPAWPWPNANSEHYQEIEATSHRPGTLPLHQEQPYHQTTPSSSTAGTPRLRSGSNYPSPRQAIKTTRPPSTLPMNGSFWLNWYGKPGRYRLSRACRHIGPQHTRASEMPSSRLNRTYPRGRPRWPYWITKNSLPPRPAQTFGPWNLNNFSDWWRPSTIGRRSISHRWLPATTTASWTTLSTRTALPTCRTFWTSCCRTSTNTISVGAQIAALSSRPHTGSTQQHQTSRANTFAPDAAPSIGHGQQPLSTIQTRSSAQQHNALWPRSPQPHLQTAMVGHNSSHHIHRYVLFVSDEVPNNQRPEVAQWLQTSSRPGGHSPQPITWSTSSTSRVHQHGADSCTDATIFPAACGQPRHPEPSAMRTKQPQWKWDHLPKSTDPNTRVTVYHYQGCRYEWDSEHTKVLEHADCTSADRADLLQGLPHSILAVVIQSPTHMSAKHRMRPVNMFE